MIGDRMHDAKGAAANHVPCIGVSYGYGSLEELRAAGVYAIAAAPADLPAIIRSLD